MNNKGDRMNQERNAKIISVLAAVSILQQTSFAAENSHKGTLNEYATCTSAPMSNMLKHLQTEIKNKRKNTAFYAEETSKSAAELDKIIGKQKVALILYAFGGAFKATAQYHLSKMGNIGFNETWKAMQLSKDFAEEVELRRIATLPKAEYNAAIDSLVAQRFNIERSWEKKLDWYKMLMKAGSNLEEQFYTVGVSLSGLTGTSLGGNFDYKIDNKIDNSIKEIPNKIGPLVRKECALNSKSVEFLKNSLQKEESSLLENLNNKDKTDTSPLFAAILTAISLDPYMISHAEEMSNFNRNYELMLIHSKLAAEYSRLEKLIKDCCGTAFQKTENSQISNTKEKSVPHTISNQNKGISNSQKGH